LRPSPLFRLTERSNPRASDGRGGCWLSPTGFGLDPVGLSHPGLVAVATADVIGSSRYGARDRRQLDQVLRRAFREVEHRYPKAVHTRMTFRITAGDEFQWVMSDVSQTFDALMYLRAVVAGAELVPVPRFRASIGVGDIVVSKRDSPYEEDGSAFARSRLGLQAVTKGRGPLRWTKLITGASESDAAADAVLCLADYMMQGWTTRQWEAIRWSLLDFKREEIARKLDVAHQNVTKPLHAAGWLHFQVAADFLRQLLEDTAHLQTGAELGRTRRRVQER